MTTFTMQDAEDRSVALPAPVQSNHATPTETELRSEYIAEITAYVRAMTNWHNEEPDTVLLACSAYAARLSEMRVHLQRRNSAFCKQLLNREVDPLLHQIEFQFRVHSRLLSSRELDLKMAGGQP